MTKSFENKRLIMGVVNITPDSFSDGGCFFKPAKALEEIRQQFRDGADIVDLGAVATGPGSLEISESEELSRLIPILNGLDQEELTRISIDTFRSTVALKGIEAGARLINDISGFRNDANLLPSLAAWNERNPQDQVRAIAMYSKEQGKSPYVSNRDKESGELIENITLFFQSRLALAEKIGFNTDNLILDPGMGQFVSPEAEDSWLLLSKLQSLVERFQDQVFLVGVSRKGFLGIPLEERDPLSQFLGTLAWNAGVQILRTHNPKMAAQFRYGQSKLDSFV